MNKQETYTVAEHTFCLIMSEDDSLWKMMEDAYAPFEEKGDNEPLFTLTVKEEYGISEPPLFEYNEFGKSSLAIYPHIHFNMSHCKWAVACLPANHSGGIDVEEIAPFDSDTTARYLLNLNEYDKVINSRHPTIKFTILWTMKESRGVDDKLLSDLLLLVASAPSFSDYVTMQFFKISHKPNYSHIYENRN